MILKRRTMEFVGLIPAAGRATRLGNIPCSKEILPLYSDNGHGKRVFADFLLEAFRLSGIKKAHFVIRKGKWDIPEHYGNGAGIQMNLSYLIMQYPYGVPFTLYEAIPHIKDKIAVLGFPDILFSPKNAYGVLLEKLKNQNADVVLGLFPIHTKDKWDMVDVDNSGKIKNIFIKQPGLDLKYGWTLAVWKPAFTEFFKGEIERHLHEHTEGQVKAADGQYRELYPGDIFLKAVECGVKVEGVVFEDGRCIDLGTKDDLERFRKTPQEWQTR